MDYFLSEISVSNVENIVRRLSVDWRGKEDWLNGFALRLNDINKRLRDDLRENKNLWTHYHYKTRLAHHYYQISSLFNRLYIKHYLDAKSIVESLETCLELMREIPKAQFTTKLVQLHADAKGYLEKTKKMRDALEERRARNPKGEEYVSLSVALGDIAGNKTVQEWLISREVGEKREPWARKLQNLITARVIMFLEDAFTNRNHKNPAVTSNLLLSLGRAYELAGIPFLAQRYQNTSEGLLKTMLETTNEATDVKENIKNIISENVKDGTSLEQVYLIVKEACAQQFSVIDEAYIARKYNKICFKQYVEETVVYLKDLTSNGKDRRTVHDILASLRCCNSLQQIPHPLDQSVRYRLLEDNYSLLDKDDEKKWINILKKESFIVMIDFVNASKKELLFLEALMNFLELTKDTKYLESKLNLYQLRTNDAPLREMIDGVLSLDEAELGEELREVQAAAAPLKGGQYLFYEDKFRDFIIDYFEPPKTQMVKLDGRHVLQVTGVKIVLSDIVREESFKEILNNASCEEVQLIGGKSVHVEDDFDDSRWRGKNLVVYTKKIRAHNKVVWNVSGRESTRVYGSNAGNFSDGTGKQGEDGEAGESGGNVLVLAEAIIDPQNLTIISIGGDGGVGQDGGNGKDGKDGRGITSKDFEYDFPPASPFPLPMRSERIKTTLRSIKYEGTITYKWYERPIGMVGRAPLGTFFKHFIEEDSYCFEKNIDSIMTDLDKHLNTFQQLDVHNVFNGNIFIQAETEEGNKLEFSFQRGRTSCMCQSYFLFKGAPGEPGTKGGAPGLGGQGGFGGDVVLRNPNDVSGHFDVTVATDPGKDGQNGKGGKYGSHGKSGNDMGYLDYSVQNPLSGSTWPKYYGKGEGSRVELTYHEKGSSDNVWCPHRRYKKYSNKYVGMSSSGMDNHKSRQYDERRTKTENRERGLDAQATRKKTISQAHIIGEYQHLMTPSDGASLKNLFADIEKTNKELLQSIAHTSESKSEINTTAEFTRSTTHRENKRTKRFQNDPRPKVKPKMDIKSKLIKDLKVKPMPLVAWVALGTMRLTEDETISLSAAFNSLYPTTNSDKIQNMKKIFLMKYRFIIMNAISRMIFQHAGDVTTKTIDAIKVIKYLKRDEKEISYVSHESLGTLNQFLNVNGEDERQKLAHYVGNSMKSFGGGFRKVLRSFVLALGNSTSSSEDLKSCFKEYATLQEKKEWKLIVFPESFSQIDSKHSQNENIIRDIRNYIEKEGCLTLPCIQLLAHIFEVNIRIYRESNNPYEPYYLDKDFYDRSQKMEKVLHVLLQSEKCTHMMVGWEFVQLDKKREILGTKFKNVLRDTAKLDSWEALDEYFSSCKFLSESYMEVDDEGLDTPGKGKLDKVCILNGILGKFDDLEDQALLGTRLSKITDFVPGEIVECIYEKFSYEGRSASVYELCCLMNAILMSTAEGDKYQDIFRWIITAYPQDQWIDQVLLMDLETFFNKSLPLRLREKWETYLSKIKNKEVLMQLREKLRTTLVGTDSIKCVGDILFILSEIPGNFQPGELGLTEWPCALKEKYWSYKLTQIRYWNDSIELSTHSYYLLSIENNHGDLLVQMLLELIISRKNQVTPELLTTILSSFYNEAWDLSKAELDMLKNSRGVGPWVDSMKRKFHVLDGKERKLEQLCEIVQSNANTSDSVKTLLPAILKHLHAVTQKANIDQLDCESDVHAWCEAFSEKLKMSGKDITKVSSTAENAMVGMLDVVDAAVLLKRGFRLRDTQKLAVMILLKNENSTLAQVATGEGKSLIVVALSIIKALLGGKVDIITSSSVLAKRDAENNQDLYNMFGINVSHNCSEDIEVRKASYSGNQVVYGDLSDFQRDYLLHEFYNMNVLGDRKFETVVVDEVDSMLLDKGNNMLYLSHNIPGLDKLESLYLFIWQYVSSPCGDRENILLSMDAKGIREAVIYDMYGVIRIEDIKALDIGMCDALARAIWENMKSNDIIDDQSRLKIEKVVRASVEKTLSPNLRQYTDRLFYLINECIHRDRRICIPKSLEGFVELHLDRWIRNAINAFFMKSGEDYVVDVDRTGTSPDRNPNITIIDKDKGTDQSNSQWDEALHQFLQLKHGCKVSTLSLKAVFISNVSYFKKYNHLFGLTGTLGSQGERKLLREVHAVDFVTIPTAKPKQFIEHLPKLCYSDLEWKHSVKTVALNYMNKENRSVLVICDSVKEVENLSQVFGGKGAKNVHTYARDYEEFDIAKSEEELDPGHVIIATNLAGRGTDIKINDELKRAGGLHVIVAYLPKNKRIEQQAFGRAARSGEKGSGQLIILITDRKESMMVNLKNKRDSEELERISEIKSFYENQIKVEEMCFSKFKEQFVALKKSIEEANKAKSKVESVVRKGKEMFGIDTNVVPKKVEDVLLKSCINKWAFWLDKNGKFIKDWTNPLSRTSLNNSLNSFLSHVKNLKFEEQNDWAEWLDGNPVPMVELAIHFHQNKKYNEAIVLLDKAIRLEPRFSEGAHYYKAAALGCKIDWESNPDDDDAGEKQMSVRDVFSGLILPGIPASRSINTRLVKMMKDELKEAEKLFEKLGSNGLANSAIIGQMKQENKQSLIQVDAYEEQQKNMANIFRFFSGSISDIQGHPVTPERFSGWNIDSQKANDLYKILIYNGILTTPRVNRGNVSEADLKILCCEYDVPIKDFTNFLDERKRTEISDFKLFKRHLKEKIKLPSKEGFWKELVKMKILSNEVKYVVVKLDKLADADPSLEDTFSSKGVNADMKRHTLDKVENRIFLNPDQMKEQSENTYIFEKDELIRRVGNDRYDALKEKEVLAFNRRCDIQMDSLESAANSYLQTFTEGDLVVITSENEGKSIIDELHKQDVISQSDSLGRFTVLADSAAIDRLSLPSEKVKSFLKEKCLKDNGFQLAHYDSVKITNLTRNRVSHDDAQTILDELEQTSIIKKIPGTDNYRLITHYSNIETINLKTPIYNNVVKRVLEVSFTYRIALQRMANYQERKQDVVLALGTKPYTAFFWTLYDHKIICPSQVRIGVSTKDVEKAVLKLNKGTLANMLGNTGCIPRDKIEGLIENLTAKKWLTSVPSSELKDKEEDLIENLSVSGWLNSSLFQIEREKKRGT